MFNRTEFDRYVRRDSWGSAREYFYFDNIGWKIRFLSTGDLVFNSDVYIEAFLVGAGGKGVCDTMSAYDTNSCPSGGGGYHTVIEKSITNGTTYTITVGQANGGSTSVFDTTVNGGGNGSDSARIRAIF